MNLNSPIVKYLTNFEIMPKQASIVYVFAFSLCFKNLNSKLSMSNGTSQIRYAIDACKNLEGRFF